MFVLTWLTLPNYAVEEWLAIQCNYACPQTQMVIPFTSSSKYHDEKEAYERKAILSIMADAYRYVCEVPDDAGLSEGFIMKLLMILPWNVMQLIVFMMSMMVAILPLMMIMLDLVYYAKISANRYIGLSLTDTDRYRLEIT